MGGFFVCAGRQITAHQNMIASYRSFIGYTWLQTFSQTMAHPRGFEPLASAFGGQRSIQLSYGCRDLRC